MSRTTRWLVPSLLLAWSPRDRLSSRRRAPAPYPALPENVRVEKDIDYRHAESPSGPRTGAPRPQGAASRCR